jgi:hypothetical protein
MAGAGYRVKPAAFIVDQLQQLSGLFSTPYFQFTDESCPPELLEEMADLILERNLKLYYLCYARLDEGFTVERLKKLRRSGLRRLMFGLESGSDRMLSAMNKGITAARAEQVLANCREADVNVRLFVIFGLPGETLEDAWETRSFLRRIRSVLQDPHNSFEINLFHLDPFSRYGMNLEKFNIEVQKNECGDFFLGGDGFTCAGSMDRKTLHQFIKQTRDELAGLADMQAKHSGWEEYSLLTISREKP